MVSAWQILLSILLHQIAFLMQPAERMQALVWKEIPNKNCVYHQTLFLKQSLIIRGSSALHAAAEKKKWFSVLDNLNCFRMHTAQYKRMALGTFICIAESNAEIIYTRTCRWLHMACIPRLLGSLPSRLGFNGQDRNCPLLYAWLTWKHKEKRRRKASLPARLGPWVRINT